MQPEALEQLVADIQQKQSETQTVELKAAEHGCPTRLYDTLSAFSNQDGGGVIIFGVSEPKGYAITGVYDAQDLQKHVTEQCKQMEPPVRALFTVSEIDGKAIVSAEIPGVDVVDRPVFYKGIGRIKGSYVRVGESDEPMSEYEVYSYEAFRRRIRDDIRPVENAGMKLLDEQRLADYLTAVKRDRANLSVNVPDKDLLEMMGVAVDGNQTLAGAMTFSRYPQTWFPQLCITAVAVAGTEIGDMDDEGSRFIDNQRITGAIPDMLEAGVAFVRKNSRIKTIIDDDGHRTDKPEYPIKAVREAILNALVHRDYSIHTENTPIRIEMYRDRLEIINSGGLYGRLSLDKLGKVRPETRNAALANILELLKVTENRYSGIPTMRKACHHAGLPEPVFTVRQGEFRVVFKNNYADIAASPENALLAYCEEPRSRAELVAFTGKSRTYTMSKIVQPLVDSGKLRLTIPDKPKSAKQRFQKV